MIEHHQQQTRFDAVAGAVFLITVLIALVAALAFFVWGVTNVAPSGQARIPSVESVLWKPTDPAIVRWAVTGQPPATPVAMPCLQSPCSTGPRLAGKPHWCWCQ